MVGMVPMLGFRIEGGKRQREIVFRLLMKWQLASPQEMGSVRRV